MSSPEPSTPPDSDTESQSESKIGASEIDLLGDTLYGSSTRALNDVIARLHDCGADQIVSLPKIAVIGKQSSGKSSLIEAISQIKVPRSNGTCTRCPMEVMLRIGSGKKEEWNCRISLRTEYNDIGQRIGDSVPKLFAETKDAREVTGLLRGAQLAILNPHKDPVFFVRDNLDYQAETSLMFSPNAVVMEITGGKVDINFIDLPGLISNGPNVSFEMQNVYLTAF
jgi:hypothetical protein